MRRAMPLLAIGAVALAAAQYPGTAKPPKEFQKGFNAITEGEARATLGYLAGPECEGRGTGQPGFQKAADFIADKFKSLGLKPLGENGSYFQYGTFYRATTSDSTLETADGAKLTGDDLALRGNGASISVSGPVVLVRAGATDELSETQAKELNGKIVIAMVPQGRTRLRSQVIVSDAKAFLTVVDRVAPTSPRVTQRNPGTPKAPSRIDGQISRAAVAKLGGAAGAFLAQAQGGASLVVLPRDAKLSATGKTEEVKVPNVVALLEGSDPTLKNEYIGVGGHLDHLGVRDGVIYYGADDDGSGSTAVTLVAKALVTNNVKPKRSIVFMTFFGEEMGLLGSKFLVDHPPVPLDKMVAELQMDMVGRDSDGEQNGDPNRVDKREENVDTIRLVGSKRISTDLDRTIQDVNRYIGFKFKYDAEDVYTRSDHYNFAAKGIPIAFLFDGFHPDYHQPTDTIEKIDFPKLTNAAKLYYLTALTIANHPSAPRKDVPQNSGD